MENNQERFIMPTDEQLVKAAVLFAGGVINKNKLTDMVAMAQFIIARLYENGDITIPAQFEAETDTPSL